MRTCVTGAYLWVRKDWRAAPTNVRDASILNELQYYGENSEARGERGGCWKWKGLMYEVVCLWKGRMEALSSIFCGKSRRTVTYPQVLGSDQWVSSQH